MNPKERPFRSRKWDYSSTNPPPPDGAVNGIWQVSEDGLHRSVHVPRGAGGSGSGIFRTDFNNEPTDAVVGDADFYDNASVIARFSGTVWQTHGPIFPLERPVQKTETVEAVFTAINQGVATVDTTHSGIHVLVPASSGVGLRVFVQSVETAGLVDYVFSVSHDPHLGHWQEIFRIENDDTLTPDQIGWFADEESGTFDLRTTLLHWEIVAADPASFAGGFISNFFGVDTQAFGLLVRDSTSGKLITLQETSTASGLLLEVKRYDSPSSLNGTDFAQLILSPFMFLRIELLPRELSLSLRQSNWYERNTALGSGFAYVDLHDDTLDGNLLLAFVRSRPNLGDDTVPAMDPSAGGIAMTSLLPDTTANENGFYATAAAAEGQDFRVSPFNASQRGMYVFEFNGTMADHDEIDAPDDGTSLSITVPDGDYILFAAHLKPSSGSAYWTEAMPAGWVKYDSTLFMEFALHSFTGGTFDLDITGYDGSWFLIAVESRNVDQSGFRALGGSALYGPDEDDRRHWSITTSAANSFNGLGSNAFDNIAGTAWTSDGTLPASITIDMLTAQTFNAIRYFAGTSYPFGESYSPPTDIEVYVSDDGVSFTLTDTFTGLATSPLNPIVTMELSSTYVKRYIKLNVTAADGSRVTIAEIYPGLIS